MRLPATAICIAALALAPAAALAGVLQVPIDHSVKLTLAGPAASVVVGNPAVADVHVVDSRTVFVAGRGFGSTDVTVLDSLGRTLYASDVEVAPARRGQVAVYRGAVLSDLSCTPNCAVVAAAGAPASGQAAAAAGTATTAANTAAALPGGSIGGMLGGGVLGAPK